MKKSYFPVAKKTAISVTVAIARELCGFVWHHFRLMEPRMSSHPAARV